MPQKAEEIFEKAYLATPEEREAILAEACGEDAGLRLEVERLLADAESAVKRFGREEDEEECDEIPEDGADLEREGDLVGPYILRQQIGEGGFGTVWMAEQREPITRMVAVKVVKAGMDTKQVLARFEAERQALAIMDHPNIARVLDAGATSSGRPYFAMELVKGIPITEYCDQQKYGPRRRLELFRDVCSAVNHAHQKGIIHRDLKPSNVMVTRVADKPVPKVIDFGIAKATQSKLTDKTLFTRYEQFLGTPVYVSPEQTALSGEDVDTRSDIYSLGVLLYELLAGAPPFDQKSLLSAGYDEMRRMIREEDPPKPSTKLSQTRAVAGSKRFEIAPSALKGELDWIVMKALEKDRARRYETANAFSQDIGRYLEDEPVLAAAPSVTYKFRKFARRNRAAFGVAAGFVLLLVAATAVSSGLAWRATKERIRAVRAENLANERLEDSEEARYQERKALGEVEDIAEFMTTVLRSPDPARDGRSITVAETLDKAASELDSRLAGQPQRLANFQATLATTYHGLGLYRDAVDLQEKAVEHYRIHRPGRPETATHVLTLAEYHNKAGNTDEELKMRREGLTIRRSFLGIDHEETITAAIALARLLFYNMKRSDEGIELLEQLPSTPDVLGNLGSFYYDTRPRNVARTIDVWTNYVNLNPAAAEVQFLLGRLLFVEGRGAEAVAPLQAARSLYPGGTRGVYIRRLLVKALLDLDLEPEAQEVQEELARLPQPINAMVEVGIAALQVWFGRNTPHAATCRLLVERAQSNNHPTFVNLAALALVLRPIDDPKTQAVALRLARAGTAWDMRGRHRFTVGLAEYRSGNYPAAEESFRAALGRLPKDRGPNSIWTSFVGAASFGLAMSLFQQDQPDEARALFASAEATMRLLPTDEQVIRGGHASPDVAFTDLIQWTLYKESGALLGVPLSKWNRSQQSGSLSPEQVDAALLQLRDADCYRWAAQVGARSFRFNEAAFYFAKLLSEFENPTALDLIRYAAVLAHLDRVAGTTSLAERMVNQFKGAASVDDLAMGAAVAFLLPPVNRQSREVGDRALAMIERCMSLPAIEDHHAYPWFCTIRGVSALRHGDHQGVEEWAGAVLDGSGAGELKVVSLSSRAMARSRAGREADAEVDLGEAARVFAELRIQPSHGELGDQWVEKVIARLVLKEAMEVVKGNTQALPKLEVVDEATSAELETAPRGELYEGGLFPRAQQ